MNKNIFNEDFAKDFFSNNFGKKYLYKKQAISNTLELMSLDILNQILTIRSNWNNKNFKMMLDKKPINYSEYSSLFVEPLGEVWRPDINKVQNWIAKGCSIILNDISGINSGLIKITNELQSLTNGRCQGNLYFSMESRKAFGPHCDDHDVFALHVDGEKVWNIYENTEKNPINHPIFKYSEDERVKKAGKLIDQITLKPGDLLYLPRGQYHDALASKSGSIHIAFGLTYFKPIDLLSLMWEKFVISDCMREDFDKNSTKKELKNHLKKLSIELAKIIDNDQTVEILSENIKKWPYHIQGYNLNNIVKEERKFKVLKSIKIEKKGLETFITNGKNAVLIPKEYEDITRYIFKQEYITYNLINDKFNNLSEQKIRDCIEKLNNMKVLE